MRGISDALNQKPNGLRGNWLGQALGADVVILDRVAANGTVYVRLAKTVAAFVADAGHSDGFLLASIAALNALAPMLRMALV